jgi:ATP-dependent Lhr-like helicase
VFVTEVEYRIIASGRTLGTHPVDGTLVAGQTLIFAGRRWRIMKIDDDARVIEVKPSRRGRPPSFKSDWGGVHDHIAATMKRVLFSSDQFPYLNDVAQLLLTRAREAFVTLHLHETALISWGDGTLIVPWLGSKKLLTLALGLSATRDEGNGADASAVGHAIEMPKTPIDAARRLLTRISDEGPQDPAALASKVGRPQFAKFDRYLTGDLMALVTVVERLDINSLSESATISLNSPHFQPETTA